MFLARVPNLKVDTVSISLKGDGLHVTIKQVFEFPPSDSERILVNFDSL